ncbi:MAG: hypothetical protein ABR500_13445 [Dermatophilaceae bacterium]
MSLRLEHEVRAALQAGTARLTTSPDPYARVMETVATHRRRRRAVVAGAGVAALALAGVIGVAAGLGDQQPDRNTPATEELQERVTRWGLPFGWPARGELATDAGFADAFTRAFGGDHHLLYAEDGDAGRVAIAISFAQEAVVFHGPRGADLDELARVPGLLVDTKDVAVALPVKDGHLIIALMPGNLSDAQFSTPFVARDGSVQRIWKQIPVDEGVARMVTSEPLGVIRVRTPAGDGPPHVVVGAGAPLGTLTCSPCDSAWFAAEGLAEFHAQAAAAVGAEPDDVTARLLLDAALPTPLGTQSPDGGAHRRVIGYVATLPSGGLLRATYVTTTGPGAATVAMVEPLRPLPADDHARPVLIPSGVGEPALIVAPGSNRVAFTPRGAAAFLADVILTDGVGVLTDPPRDLAQYRITSFESDGTVLRTWHGTILETDDPLQVFNQYRNRSMT